MPLLKQFTDDTDNPTLNYNGGVAKQNDVSNDDVAKHYDAVSCT